MCNCRNSDNCPLGGTCLQESVVYRATVKCESGERSYIGSTEGPFKTRYYGHCSDMNRRNSKSRTALSTFVWGKKDNKKNFDIRWEIHSRCQPYMCGSRKCDVCLSEKAAILLDNGPFGLNRRSELLKKCPHSGKWRLKGYK